MSPFRRGVYKVLCDEFYLLKNLQSVMYPFRLPRCVFHQFHLVLFLLQPQRVLLPVHSQADRRPVFYVLLFVRAVQESVTVLFCVVLFLLFQSPVQHFLFYAPQPLPKNPSRYQTLSQPVL